MATPNTIERKPREEVHETTERTRCGRVYRPNVDILENEHELTVLADMPGANPADIDIQFENGMLAIHGHVQPRQKTEAPYLAREYGIGDFYRTFQVSETIDAAKISAEYRDGVLTLHLPKTEAAKPRKIAVKPRP